MNELIKLNQTEIGNEAVQTVNARELYEALGLDKSNWSRWTKKNILNNQFAVENSDYVGFAIVVNGNETTDYALVIDFAKKLAMQVKTMQGEQARQYFIECSNKADKILQVMSHLEYQPKTPYLFLDGNEYKTDSLTLSKITNKHHFHIIRDIEEEILTLEENPNLDAPTKEYILKALIN